VTVQPSQLSVFLGRRDLDRNTGEAVIPKDGSPKLTHFSLVTNVVTVERSVPKLAKVTILTSLSYFIIQIPAFVVKNGMVRWPLWL